MEDKKQPFYGYALLNDAGFVRRFLSNHPKDAMAKHEIAAVVRYLKGVIKGRYGAYFSPVVQEDLAEDALIEMITSRHGFKGEAKLTTWMGKIACRVAYRYFDHNFRKGGGGNTDRSEDKADYLGDKDQPGNEDRLEDEKASETEGHSTQDYPGIGADKRGAYPITVSSDTPHWRETADATCANDAEIEDVNFLLLLDDAERRLTRKEAKAFRAIVVQQGEYKQYAAQEDMTVTAVRSLVSDAKRKLRLILGPQLGLQWAGGDDG